MPASPDEAVSSRAGAWHQSGMSSLIDGCPRQWALEYKLELPSGEKPSTAVGTAFHHAAELHERDRLAGGTGLDEDQFEDAAMENFLGVVDQIGEQAWGDDTQADAEAKVQAACWNWWHAPLKGGWGKQTLRELVCHLEPLAVEPYFRHEFVPDTRPLGGWIDMVYREPQSQKIVVLDWKTANSLRYYKNAQDKWPQAIQYAVGAILSDDIPVESLDDMWFVYGVVRKRRGKTKRFEGAYITEVDLSMAHVEMLAQRVQQAQQVVDEGKFLPNPAWHLCKPKWCSFFEECQVTGELSKPWNQLQQEHADG